jgi:hypothetical protein
MRLVASEGLFTALQICFPKCVDSSINFDGVEMNFWEARFLFSGSHQHEGIGQAGGRL